MNGAQGECIKEEQGLSTLKLKGLQVWMNFIIKVVVRCPEGKKKYLLGDITLWNTGKNKQIMNII